MNTNKEIHKYKSSQDTLTYVLFSYLDGYTFVMTTLKNIFKAMAFICLKIGKMLQKNLLSYMSECSVDGLVIVG